MGRRRTLVIATALLGASACGRVAPLQPAPGEPLPVKPLLARTTPTAEELLTPPVYASPQRIDELMKRSEPRRSDRFDLPPPDGGIAPVLPETQDPSSSEKAGPATPDEPQ
jgi:hypothetical protein